jgi:peptidoglycan/xylan/chitin deacetylase (PgdA/CDA1 family)
MKPYLLHSKGTDVFKHLGELVDELKSTNIPILTPTQYMNGKDGALITFDDGMEFIVPEIAKFLRSNEIRAIAFIIPLTSSCTSGRTDWKYWRKNLDVFEIGSHSMTHSWINIDPEHPDDKHPDDNNNSSYLDFDKGLYKNSLVNREWNPIYSRYESDNEYLRRLEFEIAYSKTIIEKNSGTKCRYFSYPWGEYDFTLKKIVMISGYEAAFSVNKTDGDRYTIQRKTIT